MELYIHYNQLPQGMELVDFLSQIDEVLEDTGSVSGGAANRLDLELEDERVNPKFAQIAVKAYLQRAGFPRDTTIEFGGMEIGVYE